MRHHKLNYIMHMKIVFGILRGILLVISFAGTALLLVVDLDIYVFVEAMSDVSCSQ